jgi:hypothetical protein
VRLSEREAGNPAGVIPSVLCEGSGVITGLSFEGVLVECDAFSRNSTTFGAKSFLL